VQLRTDQLHHAEMVAKQQVETHLQSSQRLDMDLSALRAKHAELEQQISSLQQENADLQEAVKTRGGQISRLHALEAAKLVWTDMLDASGAFLVD
jgi:predicted nuclease with TOPRIM domain